MSSITSWGEKKQKKKKETTSKTAILGRRKQRNTKNGKQKKKSQKRSSIFSVDELNSLWSLLPLPIPHSVSGSLQVGMRCRAEEPRDSRDQASLLLHTAQRRYRLGEAAHLSSCVIPYLTAIETMTLTMTRSAPSRTVSTEQTTAARPYTTRRPQIRKC